MFKCDSTHKIYVVCPASGKTGGLELLHQLVFELNKLGLNAYITYTNISDKPPLNPAFECYVKTYKKFSDIEDNVNNIVIIPELQVELISKIKKAKTVVWWLSVDNYLKVYNPIMAYRLLGLKGVAWYLKNRRWRYRTSVINSKIQYNLAQSYYAVDFLKKNKFNNIEFLSDYISKDYLNVEFNNDDRRDVVLYNPKKGIKFSKYLMSLDNRIQWIPLINLTNAQVRELLMTSKVYVDFGNHPGKDRFPREAAFCGCCVITGKKGSAAFYGDVKIEDQYKFDDVKASGMAIINQITKCFDDFEKCQKDFVGYREMIFKEPEQFSEKVKELFIG